MEQATEKVVVSENVEAVKAGEVGEGGKSQPGKWLSLRPVCLSNKLPSVSSS